MIHMDLQRKIESIGIKRFFLVYMAALITISVIALFVGKTYYQKYLFVYKYVDVDNCRIVELARKPFSEEMHIAYYDKYIHRESLYEIEDSVFINWDGELENYIFREDDYARDLSEIVLDYQRIEYPECGRVVCVEYYYNCDYAYSPSLDRIFYSYDDNGDLLSVSYDRDPMVFGTFKMSGYNYYDNLGRVKHAEYYITHGSLEYFFIYKEDNDTRIPDMILFLDHDIDGIHARLEYTDRQKE